MQKKLVELQEEFNTDFKNGLSSEQVTINKEKYGSNVLEAKKKKSWFVRFLLQFKDPLIIILLIAAIVSVVVDYHEWVESLIILIFDIKFKKIINYSFLDKFWYTIYSP